jgi:hypothetical protein
VKLRLFKIGMALGLIVVGAHNKPVRGDGGTIRLSQCDGSYRITVFTSPAPFRAGPVDISVLVQDAATGELIPEAQVSLVLTPHDLVCQSLRVVATTKAATNKLLKAAVFEWPEPGLWGVEVAIAGEQKSARVRFDLVAAERLPKWPELWLWIGWPAVAILLVTFHKLLIWRKSIQSQQGERHRLY